MCRTMERMTIHIFSSSFLAASQPPPCHHAAKADNAPRTCQMGGKAAGPESGRDDTSSPPNDGKGSSQNRECRPPAVPLLFFIVVCLPRRQLYRLLVAIVHLS
mmetsp:Transcript_20201/g.57342  ORF Transcript_20201/g.57342 Transcript_20201/m.57342 type:complete len:103 (+) Transcript_20201:1149-1457(+)